MTVLARCWGSWKPTLLVGAGCHVCQRPWSLCFYVSLPVSLVVCEYMCVSGSLCVSAVLCLPPISVPLFLMPSPWASLSLPLPACQSLPLGPGWVGSPGSLGDPSSSPTPISTRMGSSTIWTAANTPATPTQRGRLVSDPSPAPLPHCPLGPFHRWGS